MAVDLVADRADEELPEGWAIGLVEELARPGGIAYGVLKPGPNLSNGIPMLRVKDIQGGGIDTAELYRISSSLDQEFRRTKLAGGEVLLSIQGSVGRVAVVPMALRGANVSRTLAVIPPAMPELAQWLYLSLQAPAVRVLIEDATGGTTRDSLNLRDLRKLSIPLPPLAEQKRIVAKVEELLARVNAARERLARVPAILKRFRQSVLAAACSGRLTADWRNANPQTDAAHILLEKILARRRKLLGDPTGSGYSEPFSPVEVSNDGPPEHWATASMDQLTSLVTSGSRGWAQYYSETGAIFIRAQDINTDDLSLAHIAHVAPPANAEGQRTRVQYGDLLITITGANVTKSALVNSDLGEAYVSQHVALLRPVDISIRQFMFLWTISPLHGRAKLLADAYGAGKPGLNLDHIRQMAVALPPLEEQIEIVHRVESLLKLADALEMRLATGTFRTERLTQAILAKAFRGELVPTEAELARAEGRPYEPASALLARVRSSHAVNRAPVKRTRPGGRPGKPPGRYVSRHS
jgi:type I restriction enzyme S subunit